MRNRLFFVTFLTSDGSRWERQFESKEDFAEVIFLCEDTNSLLKVSPPGSSLEAGWKIDLDHIVAMRFEEEE